MAMIAENLKPDPRNSRYKSVVCSQCHEVRLVRNDTNPTFCRRCAGLKGSHSPKLSRITGTVRECLVCGSEFWQTPSTGQKYCSKRCADNGRAKLPLQTRLCVTCGKAFDWRPRPSTNSRGTYCSLECRNRDYQNIYRGHRISLKLEPRVDWVMKRRHYVADHSGFCVACGSSEHLEVHHIIAYRVTHDNESHNLVTLCHTHHKAFQKLTDRMETEQLSVQETVRAILQAHIEERWHTHNGLMLLQAA